MVSEELSKDSQVRIEDAHLMRAVLALMAADRDERIEGSSPRRSEIVLADAGFSAREISGLTGRKYEAVRSALRRRARRE